MERKVEIKAHQAAMKEMVSAHQAAMKEKGDIIWFY
jgi:hypothetical protein